MTCCLYYSLLFLYKHAYLLQISGKKRKDRLTLLLICNMSGTDKQRPVIIHKVRKPHCFKRDHGITPKDLPVDYYSSRSGFINHRIFQEILSKWNRKLVRQNRKVLLMVDNASSHTLAEYSNINMQYLMPRTTSKLQPLDQGIIYAVKTHYKASLARKYLMGIEAGKTPEQLVKKWCVKLACDELARVWKRVSPQTILNCFRAAGFTAKGSVDLSVDETDDDVAMRPEEWLHIQTVRKCLAISHLYYTHILQ